MIKLKKRDFIILFARNCQYLQIAKKYLLHFSHTKSTPCDALFALNIDFANQIFYRTLTVPSSSTSIVSPVLTALRKSAPS